MAEYRDPNKDSDSDSDSFGDALEKHINEHDYDEWTKLNPTFRPEEENGEPEPGGGEPEELTEEDFADAVEMAEKELNQMKINEGEDEEKSKTVNMYNNELPRMTLRSLLYQPVLHQ